MARPLLFRLVASKSRRFITAPPAREMQLKPGETAAALIKATEEMILRI